MKRLTIARIMIFVAAFALDAAILRAFLVEGMFAGLVLITPVLQLGFWRWRRTSGRWRGFWLGFEVGGVLGIAALFAAELWPESLWNRTVHWLVDWAYTARWESLPESVQMILDDHDEWFAALVYFLYPSTWGLLGGALGGGLARLPGQVPAASEPLID